MNWCKMVPEITVTSFEKSIKFYTTILGFEIKYSRTLPNFAYLEFEGSQIMIEEHHSEGWNIAEMVYPFGRGVNFQIECSDVNDLYKRITNAGIGVYLEMQDNWYETGNGCVGNREFIVQDPDGYMLRFAQDMGTRSK